MWLDFFTVNIFLRLTVKILSFLRLTAKFLADLWLTVNPIETLFSGDTIAEIEREKFQYLKLKISRRRKSQLVVSRQVVTNQCCGLAVILCGFISHLIGRETINNPENFSGLQGFTEKTVKLYRKWQHKNHIWYVLITKSLQQHLTKLDLVKVGTFCFDLRWLKTVSSIFQDVDFDGSLLPLFIG